ncbi:MAG: TonB-dependent receptor [Ignavibacteriales bacterium]|nr:TonB-dependent receptor [Ignavibacteriales bacterium]
MKKILYASLFLIIIIGSLSFAQQTGTLRGVIVDSTNGETLAYVTIYVEETKQGIVADLNGNFTLPAIPAIANLTLKVSHVGYETKQIHFNITANKITQLTIELNPRTAQLQEIETIGKRISRQKETDIGLQRITIKELELLPKSVETDIMRSLQLLPGVKSSGDVSARYYVRGGSSDQNLILLNGVSVYNPFHAMGLFSVIDPEMINVVEFYKGGYTAEFGDRLSSVLNLVTKNGNRNRFAGSANLSFLTGKASVEGPIPNGSFIITGRKSLFDNVLKKFLNYKDAPFDFHDLSFKANYVTTDEKRITKVSLFGFNSGDKLKNENKLREDFSWSNNLFGATWFQAWESPLYSELTLSYSNFRAEVLPNESSALPRRNKVDDITLKMDFNYIYDSRDELRVGYSVKSFNSEYSFVNLRNAKTNISDFGANISIYGKYRLLRFDKFIADAGTRINAASLAVNNKTLFEPRVSIKYNMNPLISLKAAWGIYSQEMVTLSDDNDIISLFEPWIIVPDYLRTPSAVHYVIGADINITENLMLNIEGYYKLLHNITELNKDKVDAEDPDLVSISGESYGWEFMLNYLDQKINATVSYTLSWAYKNLNNWIYYPRYDSRHQVTVNLSYDLGSRWNASAIWTLSTGQPFTQIEGFYDKLYFKDLFSMWFILENYEPFTILADKNLGRLPYYHRLDLSVSKKFRLFFSDLSLSFSIINVYDRKNLFYLERKTGRRVNMLPFLPTASIRIDL